MRKLLLVLIVISSIRSYSQNDRFAPSPNAASLGIYGSIPVSLYTGVANIEVPLYEINVGDLKLPISLSYLPTGINVQSEASWVGLGWTLNSGGCITRTIQGLDDFGENTSRGYPFDPPSNPSEFGVNQYDICLCNYDGEPDIFYYNFAGLSGRFYFSKGQDNSLDYLVATVYNDVKTKVIYFKYQKKWEITTSDGVKYIFQTPEVGGKMSGSSYEYFEGLGLANFTKAQGAADLIVWPRTNAWYLNRIQSPNGSIIDFEYDTKIDSNGDEYSYYEGMSVWNRMNRCEVIFERLNYGRLPSSVLNSYFCSLSAFTNVYIKRIYWKNGEINFTKSDREDIKRSYYLHYKKTEKGPQKLDLFQIKNSRGEVIKTYDFKTTYFNNDKNQDSNQKALFKRLKLDSIIVSGKGGELGPIYKFQYDESLRLPSKESFAKDYWGYYNGANENASLIPQKQFYDLNHTLITVGSANRFPNKYYMQAGILKQITYPTGAITTFDYQPHDYYTCGTPLDENFNVPSKRQQISYSAFDGMDETYFELSQTTSVIVSTQIAFVDMIKNSSLNNPFAAPYNLIPSNIYGFLSKVEENENANFENITNSYLTFNLGLWQNRADKNSAYQIIKQNISLPAGKYKIMTRGFKGISALINLSYNNENNESENLAGGLRVSRITNTLENGQKHITRYTYSSKVQESNNPSSGLLLLTPDFFITSYGFYGKPTISDQLEYVAYVGYSYSTVPLGSSAQGSTVGYDKVNVLYGEKGEGGWEENFFINWADRAMYGNFTPPVSSSDNGLTTSKNYYNSTGSKVKSEHFTYYTVYDIFNSINGYNSSSLSLGWKKDIIYDDRFHPANCLSSRTSNYNLNFNYYPLEKKVETKFDPLTKNKVLQEITKTYQYNSKYQIKSETSNLAGGREYKTSYKYPIDYNITNDIISHTNDDMIYAIHRMQLKNILDKPIETVEYIDGKAIKGKLILYKNFSANVTQPFQEYLLSTKNPLLPSLTSSNNNFVSSSIISGMGVYAFGKDFLHYVLDKQYNNYDITGNILEYQRPYDKPVFYIWGYNDTKPIARIKNSINKLAFAYSGFEPNTYGFWIYSGNPIESSTSKIGQYYYSLSNGNIKKYLNTGRYVLEYYAKGDVLISGVSVINTFTSPTDINGWIYYRKEVSATGSPAVMTLNGTTDIDELRLYPSDAQMDSYSWDPLNGMTSHTDPNGLTTYFEYDALGRLNLIYDHYGNPLNKYDYHFSGQDVTDNFFMCKVVFNTQGGSLVPEISVKKGSSIVAPVNPSRTGYTFIGWYKEPNCATSWNFGTDRVLNKTILYAKWAIKTYSITTTTSVGGTASPAGTTTVNHGSALTITLTPNSGCRVKDVKVNSVSVGAVSSYTFSSVTSNQNLYAEFTQANSVNPTTLFFGSIATSQTVSIFSTTSWTATKSASWITITPTSGTGNGTITVKPSKNIGIPRSGSITVNFGSSTQTITIEQESTTIIPEKQI